MNGRRSVKEEEDALVLGGRLDSGTGATGAKAGAGIAGVLGQQLRKEGEENVDGG